MRRVLLPGLPQFNGADDAYRINQFDGWWDSPTPTPVLVANGGAPGAVAVGDWQPAEKFYTISGRIFVPLDEMEVTRRALLAAVPADREVPIEVFNEDETSDLQVFVRLADKVQIDRSKAPLQFTIPLVAPDPYKYARFSVGGAVGVFAGVDWFRVYTDGGGGDWFRSYEFGGRSYAQQGDTGLFPTATGLDSPGDATSRRVTITVHGPLPLGWWLENSTTAARLWTELPLVAGQTLTYDCQHRTARLDGADVTHLTFGDFLTLEPGPNTYRLVAPDDDDGFAQISAFPAYL